MRNGQSVHPFTKRLFLLGSAGILTSCDVLFKGEARSVSDKNSSDTHHYPWVPENLLPGTCGLSSPPPAPWIIGPGGGGEANFVARTSDFGYDVEDDAKDNDSADYYKKIFLFIGKSDFIKSAINGTSFLQKNVDNGHAKRLSEIELSEIKLKNSSNLFKLYSNGNFYKFIDGKYATYSSGVPQIDFWLSNNGNSYATFRCVYGESVRIIKEYIVLYSEFNEYLNIGFSILGTFEVLLHVGEIKESVNSVLILCQKEN